MAPHVAGSVARQRGAEPPPHSSVKTTTSPSLLNVAECQYAKFGSATSATRIGFAGSVMSSRIPFPEHAPPASPIPGYAVMSWHWFVRRELCVPSPWSPPCQRPAMLPCSSAKMRGMFTISAAAGSASGTFTTSMRKSAVFSSSSGSPPEQPGQLLARTHAARALDVDVDVLVVGWGR